jgi:hypothetical protein
MALPLFRTDALRAPKAPNLPLAPGAYNNQYHEQLNNVLRLYFNQLDNFNQLFATNTGGGLLQFPHGAFSSDQDQTTTANTATLMTLNTTDFSNGGVTISSSKITTAIAGTYNLQFSAQFQNTDNQIQDISIWLRQNGVDIPGSTGFISIPAHKSAAAGQEAKQISGWNYYVQMQANDYIEIYWSTTSATVTIQHYPASTGPVRPSTQSVVATLSFVSALFPTA